MVTILIYKLADIPLDVALGIYSGAVTNTPSLGAGQQILSELGMSQTTSNMGMAYAMAYPFWNLWYFTFYVAYSSFL